VICWIAAVSAKNRHSPISAPAKAFTVIPVRISVTTSVRPPDRDITYTSRTVPSPAAKADAEGDRGDRADRRARGDPDDAGLCEGVAEHALLSAPAHPS
jgi:hypothetical protein